MVSRRAGRMCSHLACGTGDHRIGAVPSVGRCAGRMAALSDPHPYLLAHEFKYRLPTGDFQPARWTVMPAPAGTMCHHAGKIGERRLADPPFLQILGMV